MKTSHRIVRFCFGLLAIFASLQAVSAQSAVNGFVGRSGNRLILNGSPFRCSGANIYWLGLDENVGGVAYPTSFRVDDVFATASEMGTNVVRSHMLCSVGNTLSIKPTLAGSLNATALQKVDYAIKVAGDNGIRLILPLVDNYHYYHGGKYTFTNWRGITDENQFYTNATVVNDFKSYVSQLLNHVNSYTGVAYKNDPTILAWETGNEINPPVSWTQTIADYIKSIDVNHLVVDGTYGINTGALSLANVDIYSDHYYPLNATQLASDANTAASANKAFIVGEYAWNNGDLNSFLSTAQGNANVAGDFYWSLFGHADTYGFVQHNDGYTVHYPGDTTAMQSGVQTLRSHAYAMRGLANPAPGYPWAPWNLQVNSSGSVIWTGAAKGATYQIERSTVGASGPWTVTTSGSVTDNNAPWLDAAHPGGTVWYRIKAANLAGNYGAYSSVYLITYAANTPLIDPLNNFSLVYAKSANWAIDTSNPGNFNNDAGRANRTTASTESITYNKSNLTSFAVQIYNVSGQTYTVSVSVSPDNTNWTMVPTTVSGSGSGAANWSYQNLSNTGAIGSGKNYVKITISGGGVNWAPQISQVTVN